MKLIIWNCKKDYNYKAKLIVIQEPDLVIIPECEKSEFLTFAGEIVKPTDFIWYGEPSADRGIGIFSYSNYQIKLLEIHNPAIKHVIPVLVTNGKESFNLLAVWTLKPYTKQMWDAIKYYSGVLANDIIIAGDFNSNSLWDSANKNSSHSEFVKHLESKEILSVYHHFYNETQGKESTPTFHWYHHEDKPFHIDYCFASKKLISKLTNVEIGKFADWAKHSDHMPMSITFDESL